MGPQSPNIKISVWSQIWVLKFRWYSLIFTGGDELLQDESLYDHVTFQFLCGAAYFHICNLLSAKNCVIADPWETREI